MNCVGVELKDKRNVWAELTMQTVLIYLAVSFTFKMDARNLGLCLSPSLFSLSCPPRTGGAALSRRGSFRRTRAVNTPSAITAAGHKELSEHMYSSRCLTDLVIRYEAIFAVPADMLQTCKFTHLEFGDPVPYTDLGRDREGMGGYHSYVEECIATVTKVRHAYLRSIDILLPPTGSA